MASHSPTLRETAPSRVRQSEPTLARWVGGIGWGIVLVGLIVVGANRWAPSPRLFSEGFGWLFLLVGLVMTFVHISMETDELLRRAVGLVGGVMMIGGIGWGLALAVKGRSWGVGLVPFVPGLCLVALYARGERDQSLRRIILNVMGALGLAAALLGVAGTIIKPDWLAGRWSVLMLGGLAFSLIYLAQSSTSHDAAFFGSIILGLIGLLGIVWAAARSIIWQTIHEWRQVPDNEHLIALAAGLCLLLIGVGAFLVLGSPAAGAEMTDSNRLARRWGRIGAVAGIFLIFLAIVRYFSPNVLVNAGWAVSSPPPYLMPTGIILMLVGVVYGAVSLGFWSENRLVVMTRRELSAYFVSPIAYCVLIGFVLMAMPSYYLFVEQMQRMAKAMQPVEEPVVLRYMISFLPVVAVMLAVPLLTMQLFSEEKRSGSIEILLTAPVSDALVVASKFLAGWFFFMLLWWPWWLFLLAMRLEGGQPFDFRPMLSYILALMATGAGFVSMGVFFSSITRNQIIAAVLTFMGMMLLICMYFLEDSISSTNSLAVAGKNVFRAMSFIQMWINATLGRLYIRDFILHGSLAAIWLFLTLKVLEVRRWS